MWRRSRGEVRGVKGIRGMAGKLRGSVLDEINWYWAFVRIEMQELKEIANLARYPDCMHK